MNLPLAYFPLMEIKYMQLLEEQKMIALSAKEKLMSIYPELMNQFPSLIPNDDPKYEIAIEVRRYYGEALFFHDKESLNKLKELKIVANAVKFKNISRWFVTIQDIHNQYEEIRSKSIRTDRLLAYSVIKMYLIAKFSRELLTIYTPTIRDEIRMPQLTKDLINLKKRREYSGTNPKNYKSFYEVLLNNSINEFTQIPIEEFDLNFKFDIDSFIDISKGKTESNFLRILVEQCFSYNEKEISKTKFLSIVFDLLKLLMPDRELMDEETFDLTSHLTYKSYDSYKAHVLKKILYPKRKLK